MYQKIIVKLIFIAPEPQAQVHYCYHALSVVRPSSLTFHIFDFSETTDLLLSEQNSTKPGTNTLC